MISTTALRASVKRALRHSVTRGLAIYLILPNLVFFVAGRFLFMHRPLFNADYLVVWIVSRYLSRKATVALYCVVLALDLILSAASIYFLSTADVFHNVYDIAYLNPYMVYPAIAALLLFLAAVFVFGRKLKASSTSASQSGRNQAILIIATLVGFSISLAHAIPRASTTFEHTRKSMIVDFRIAEIARWGVDSLLGYKETRDPNTRIASTTGRLWSDLSLSGGAAPPYNIVLILVESDGLLKNADDMRRIFAPLFDPSLNSRYSIRSGSIPFEGATVSAELRSLCRVHAWQVNLFDPKSFPACLPKLLAEHGYATESFHGNSGNFFNRPEWYGALGFQHSNFSEQLAPKVVAQFVRCGTLIQGVCDLGIVKLIRRELLAPASNKKFIYWLTLSSHLPVDSEMAQQSAFDCGRDSTLSEYSGPCDLARIHYQLHQAIAKLALDPDLPTTRFIVVGDHMPPFLTLGERDLYDNRHVPFVDLIPRGKLAAIVGKSG